MAGYRQIHTQIWKDEWYIELSPEEKLIFVYLFSNELASISGIYKIPVRVISNETGVRVEDVLLFLENFERAGKIMYADGVLWVKNMSKFHANASPRTQKKVQADIDRIPDCAVKQAYIQCRCSIDTVSDDADMVSIPRSESVSVNKSVNKKENESESKNATEKENGEDEPVKPGKEPIGEENIFELYEKEIGALTPLVANTLKCAKEDFPDHWIVEAIAIAVRNNKRSWGYAESILKRWQVEGFKVDNRKGRDSPGPVPKKGGNGSVDTSNLDALIRAEGIL